MPRATTASASGRLLSVIPRWLVIVFTATAFLFASILLIAALVWPENFENATTRFVLCAAIALDLSVFFFVIYPHEAKLTKVPAINLSVSLVGPIVLFIVILLLLWKLMPESPGGSSRFFVPYEQGVRAEKMSFETVQIAPMDGPFEYYVVPDRNRFMAGVYVQFASGQTAYRARLSAPYYEDVEVVFSRGPGTGRFEVHRRQ
jgi:hypothetical protein